MAINSWFGSDLEKRCYFVKTKKRLRYRLTAFRANESPSKLPVDFKKEYCKLAGRQVREKIAEFLERLI